MLRARITLDAPNSRFKLGYTVIAIAPTEDRSSGMINYWRSNLSSGRNTISHCFLKEKNFSRSTIRAFTVSPSSPLFFLFVKLDGWVFASYSIANIRVVFSERASPCVRLRMLRKWNCDVSYRDPIILDVRRRCASTLRAKGCRARRRMRVCDGVTKNTIK